MRIRGKKSAGMSYLVVLIMVVIGVESNWEEQESFLAYLIDTGVIDSDMAELLQTNCSSELLHAKETLQNLKSCSEKERSIDDDELLNGRPSTTKVQDDIHMWCPQVKQILLDCLLEKNLTAPMMLVEKDMNTCSRYRELAQSTTEITVQTTPNNMTVIVVAPVTFIVAVLLWCFRCCGLGFAGTKSEEGPLLTVSLSSNSGARLQNSASVGSSMTEDKNEIPLGNTSMAANNSAEDFVHITPGISPFPGIPPLKPPPGRKIPPGGVNLMLPPPPGWKIPPPPSPPSVPQGSPRLLVSSAPAPPLAPPAPPPPMPSVPPPPPEPSAPPSSPVASASQPLPVPMSPPPPHVPQSQPPPLVPPSQPPPLVPPIPSPVRPVAPHPPSPGPPPPRPPPIPSQSCPPGPPPPLPPSAGSQPPRPPPPSAPSTGPGPRPPGPPPPPRNSSSARGGPLPPPPPGAGAGPTRTPSIGVKFPQPPGAPNAYTSNKAKLKPFFWDKVTASPNSSMVWHAIKAGSFQFDEEMMESLFGYTAPAKTSNVPKKESSSQAPPKSIQLLEPKKSQNLSIILKALNVTANEVCDAIEEGNELPAELIQTLVKMAPTSEEELKLRLYDGELCKLNLADRFLKLLTDIPFAYKRLEALLFMVTLEDEVEMLKDSFVVLEAACTELRKSRLFLKLLEAVLKTGNRMNDGTFRGGAQAFKLDTLLKLSDLKGADGKTTLLHFIVIEIIRTEGIRAFRAAREMRRVSSITSEDLLDDSVQESDETLRSMGLQAVSGLSSELEHVKKAAVLDIDALTGTVAKMGNELVKAKEFLNSDMKSIPEDNGFHETLKNFVKNVEGDVTWLLQEEKQIMSSMKSTADYFHGKSGKDEGIRLFVVVRDFLILLDKVCSEVKNSPIKPLGKSTKKEESVSTPPDPNKTTPADPPQSTRPDPPNTTPTDPQRSTPADPPKPPPQNPGTSTQPPDSGQATPADPRHLISAAITRMRIDSSSSSSDDDS